MGTLLVAQAQQVAQLLPISQPFERYLQHSLTEKLFAHLDQPVYSAGETMWLKLYAVDGTYHKPLPLSKVAYVEVLDATQQPVAQAKLVMQQGTGQGSLRLPPDLPTGRYLVRAYTSWMRNAGPDYFFQTTVTILNTFGTAGAPAAGTAPVAEAHFFPEGGNLVQGLPSKVGFQVVDKAGHGLAATGTVRNGRGEAVASFQTLKFGLGSFAFTPTEAGAAYTAQVRLPTGAFLTSKLPAAYPQGWVLQVAAASPTQLRLTVQTTVAGEAGSPVYLLAHSGQQPAAAQAASVAANGQATFLVEKASLLGGISHFTVFNSHRQPVCERLYFQRPSHQLQLSATLDKASYPPRERVSLALTQAGASSAANASVAVYRLDSLSAPAEQADITSFLYLTSDLKGAVESPAYYCQDSSLVAQQAADNLMLTHGWSRFRWEQVLAAQPPRPAYLPELYGPILRGRVTSRATGAPAPGVSTYLSLPGRAFQFHNAVSQADGLVSFELRNVYGPRQLVLQTNLERDSLYQLEVLSPFSTQAGGRPAVASALPERLAPELRQRHLQAQVQQAFAKPQQQAYRLPPLDSTAFYGVPSETYRLDDFTRFKVLEEVMREYVPGVLVRHSGRDFHFKVLDKPRQGLFQDDPLILLDGVPVFSTNKIMAFDPLKIKQLDVVTAKYFLESQAYSGVVSYTTYKGDLAGFPLDARVLLEEYEGLQGQREFYAPRYETTQAQQGRLPDLRNLLYWNADLNILKSNSNQTSFYTSDQLGRYLVVVQGLAANGQSGRTTAVFEVKPAF